MKKDKKIESNCESCVWYDYDEFYGENVCRANLDEDEMVDYLVGSSGSCPLYRFYDEYKSVQKQN
ncbi:MAG: hypothetical protein IJO00_03235 [Clostridia bacterium]|nr:hypothetical protein [Clostridia bacterium]